jgi:DNA-binding NarL/FixJ family response regulator
MAPTTYEDTVAVINSSEDTVEMLRQALHNGGFRSVVSAHIHDFKTGESDFPKYLQTHDPQAIIYDIAIPYEQNWTFLKLLLDSEHMRGRKVVLTTTNKKRLEELVGPTDALEIVGKPYDIDEIVRAVKAALGKS